MPKISIAVLPRFHFAKDLSDFGAQATKVETPIPSELIRRKVWAAVLTSVAGFPVANGVQGYVRFTLGGADAGEIALDYSDQQAVIAQGTVNAGADMLAISGGPSGAIAYLSPFNVNTQADKVQFILSGPVQNFPNYMLALAVLSEYPL